MTRRPVVVPVSARPAPPAAAPPPAPRGFTGGPVSLVSGPFDLRSLTPADVTDDMVSWFNDDVMTRGLNLGGLAFTVDSLRQMVARFDNWRHFITGIFERTSGQLIGFYTIDVDPAHNVGQITTGIGRDEYRGRGVLWATIDVLLDDFFDRRGLDKMSARIVARNFRMLFNFKDTPRFILEARLRQECRAPDGRRVDILVFSAFRGVPPGAFPP